MSSADEKKQAVARAAIEFIEYDDVIGVGTGSTVDYFIDYLKPLKNKISGAVASSLVTQKKLESNGIRILDLNDVSDILINAIHSPGNCTTEEITIRRVAGDF